MQINYDSGIKYDECFYVYDEPMPDLQRFWSDHKDSLLELELHPDTYDLTFERKENDDDWYDFDFRPKKYAKLTMPENIIEVIDNFKTGIINVLDKLKSDMEHILGEKE